MATRPAPYVARSPRTKAVASTLLVFILVAALTRYISLASILAASSFPLWIYLYREPVEILIWALVGSALIVARHHENIRRLLAGRENKFAPGGRT